MSFNRGPRRVPALARVRAAVFAVGARVCVDGSADHSARVTLSDPDERPLAVLPDGAEVTILAWRPGSGDTTRYHVRATEGGLEGWLPVAHLRGGNVGTAPLAAAVPPSVPTPAPYRGAEPSAGGLRFGQRQHTPGGGAG